MTTKEMIELFDQNTLNSVDIEDGDPSQRTDMCALMMLDRLLPNGTNIVESADHDKIYLGIDIDELAEIITESDVIYLARRGVHVDEDHDSLAMSV